MVEIRGTHGNDSQPGTAGDDILKGFEGDDTQRGGEGDDIYEPGSGSDTIQIEPDGGHDTVRGFEVGTDTLVFSGFRNIKSFEDLKPFIDTSSGSSVIDVTGANGTQATIGPTLTLSQSITLSKVDNLGEDDVAFSGRLDPLKATGSSDGSSLDDPEEGQPPPGSKLPDFTPPPLPDRYPHGPNPGPDPGPPGPNDWWF